MEVTQLIYTLGVLYSAQCHVLIVSSTLDKHVFSSRFYRAMHFSAKRGIAIACRLSVCPSVCDVGELRSHRLEFFENNFTIS